MRRRSFLALASGSLVAAPAAVASYARWVEPISLQLARHQCRLPGLAPGQSIRLLHVSDLHASPVVPNSLIESALGLALEQKPDLVCLTGDFVTNRAGWNSDWYRRTLRRLGEHVPVYATMGNHDGGWAQSRMKNSMIVRDLLRDAGIPVLHNRSTLLSVRGQELELVGLGDLWGGEFLPQRAFGCSPRPANVPRIVLSHNPDTKDEMDGRSWDLMLSGHTHGGQVILPFIGSPWTPVQDKRYVHGLLPWNHRQIHVTSGVGSAGGVRLNCPPEVALLELTGRNAT